MKKITWLSAALLVATTSATHAESVFEGFSGNVGVAYQNYNTEFSNFRSQNGTVFNIAPDESTGAVGKLGLDYAWFLSPITNISVGATYSTNYGSAKPITITRPDGTVVPDDGTMKMKQKMSIYVAPGLLINESTLAYVKLGYTNIDSQDETATVYGTSAYSYGVGGKFALDNKSFAYVEANYLAGKKSNFVSATSGSTFTIKPTGYELVVGYGFKF